MAVAVSSGRDGAAYEPGTRLLLEKGRGRGLPATMTEDVEATLHLHALHAFLEPGATLLRLDPDAMREPTLLLAPDAPVRFRSDRGSGLAALLDALRDRGDDAYPGIERAFRELFPAVHRLQLHRVAENKKVVRVQLADGALVDANQMSEGMLYALGFLCAEHADAAYALLVEEPENGLHPARIADVMRVLRRISERTQVLLATHSPLVVNELEGAEVSVVTRTDEEGTKVTPLTATHNYAERARIYKSGELWLNYCDGKDEPELLHGPVRLSAQ